MSGMSAGFKTEGVVCKACGAGIPILKSPALADGFSAKCQECHHTDKYQLDEIRNLVVTPRP
jgi:hypothetical protein